MKILSALIPVTLLTCAGVIASGCGQSEPIAQQKPLGIASTSADPVAESKTEPSSAIQSKSIEKQPSQETNPDVSPPPADRSLPMPSDTVVDDLPEWKPEGPSAEEVAGKAFLPPPNAKSLSKSGRLWIDRKRERVYIDGYVAMTRGPLEMFACPAGTKEHESIVAVLAKAREVHAALLAIDATPGTPVRFRPEFLPPTGQVIRVWVCWYDSENQFHTVDGREWIEDLETEKSMTAEWVFAGSGFWQDPSDKREYYQADSGDMICVSNFSSAMLDIAISSSADADSLRFVPFERKIPARKTPVRLVLVPVPLPADNPKPDDDANLLNVPTATDLQRAP